MKKFKIKNLILKKILESENERIFVQDLTDSISEINLTFNDVLFLCKEIEKDGHIELKYSHSKDGDSSWIKPYDTEMFLSNGGYKRIYNYPLITIFIGIITIIVTLVGVIVKLRT